MGEVAGAALGVCMAGADGLSAGVVDCAKAMVNAPAMAAAVTVVVKILETCMVKTPGEQALSKNERALG